MDDINYPNEDDNQDELNAEEEKELPNDEVFESGSNLPEETPLD